jgi:hypothetical protein
VLIMLGDRDHLNKTYKDVGITDVKIIDPDYK